MTDTSKEYASALFELAAEEERLPEISRDLALIHSQFRENPVYVDLLASPNIPVNVRLEAIDEALGENVSEEVLSFLKILCQKDSIRSVYKIIHDFNDLYRTSQGVAKARVISAVPLKSAEKDKLKAKLEKLTQKEVVMECITSPAVLGGLIVYVDGRVLDGSLRRRLHDIKEVIEK